MEDRNDPFAQKMRRYINAFSRDEETGKKEENGKGGSAEYPLQTNAIEEHKPLPKRRPLRCWHIIRQSIECEKEENVDSPDVKYVWKQVNI